MLNRIFIKDIGPASEMKLDFGERINIITGDNGLGKSFLLEAIWLMLTNTWAGAPFFKDVKAQSPVLRWILKEPGNPLLTEGEVTFKENGGYSGIFPGPSAIVIYAQVDGGFSVWEPWSHHISNWGLPSGSHTASRSGSGSRSSSRPENYIFSSREIWDGLPLDQPEKLCMGLIHDWVLWQSSSDSPFEAFTKVLEILSANTTECIKPSRKTTKFSPMDVRPIPLLEMPYGEVPITLASAAIKRILSLAYLLVWTWTEHRDLCERVGTTPVNDIIFLIDEPETHLHPQWQRKILPSLLKVADALDAHANIRTQLITTTHSPIILSSCEVMADNSKDTLYNLELVHGKVELVREEWEVKGDICKWLTTDIFDFKQPRSLEAETAILEAMERMRNPSPLSQQEVEQIESLLRPVLSDMDPFWTRWRFYVENLSRA